MTNLESCQRQLREDMQTLLTGERLLIFVYAESSEQMPDALLEALDIIMRHGEEADSFDTS